jgi:carbamoyl-phosphate synthase large subunit
MKQKSPMRVLVTAVSGGSIGEQICKCLQLDKNKRYFATANIHGAEATQGVISADLRLSLPPASSPDYLAAVMEVMSKHDLHAIVPGSEQELLKLCLSDDLMLNNERVLIANNRTTIATCLDKHAFQNCLAINGLKTPWQTLATSTDDVIMPPCGFPVIVKPASNGGGSVMTYVAQDIQELRFFVQYLLQYNSVPLVQEYIGTAEDEFTIGVLHLPSGKHAGTVVLQRTILTGLSNRIRVKNRTQKDFLGPVLAVSSGITQGVIVDRPEVAASAEGLAKKLGSTGPLNIQGRWTTDGFVAFEANPRFSGTSPMRALSGFNELSIMLDYFEHGTCEIPQTIKQGVFHRGLTEAVNFLGHEISTRSDNNA